MHFVYVEGRQNEKEVDENACKLYVNPGNIHKDTYLSGSSWCRKKHGYVSKNRKRTNADNNIKSEHWSESVYRNVLACKSKMLL